MNPRGLRRASGADRIELTSMRKIFPPAAPDHQGRFNIIGYKGLGAAAVAMLRKIIHE